MLQAKLLCNGRSGALHVCELPGARLFAAVVFRHAALTCPGGHAHACQRFGSGLSALLQACGAG